MSRFNRVCKLLGLYNSCDHDFSNSDNECQYCGMNEQEFIKYNEDNYLTDWFISQNLIEDPCKNGQEPPTRIVEESAYHKKDDPISPNHYKLKCCESWDYQIEVCSRVPGDEAALLFNVLKYATRYPLKNGIEDVKKMLTYGNKLLELLESKNEKNV